MKCFILLYILILASCAKEHVLVSELSQIEANEILVLLDSNNIKANRLEKPGKKHSTFSITVSSHQVNQARQMLVSSMLPREKSIGLLDVYPPGSSNLIPTKGEEKAKFLMALQGELEDMLKILPGVLKVRVAVVMPDDEIVAHKAQPKKARASVALVYDSRTGDMDALGKEKIALLVASAVEGLDPELVTVTLAPAKNSIQMVQVEQQSIDNQAPVSPLASKTFMLFGFFIVLALVSVMLALWSLYRTLQFKSLIKTLQAQDVKELQESDEVG